MSKFENETSAIDFLEKTLWPEGPSCCGKNDFLDLSNTEVHRKGLKRCRVCRVTLTVRQATPFARSSLPLYKCLRAIVLMASPGGVSVAGLARDLGVTRNTARELTRRIRGADPCQVSLLVRALAPSVAVPLNADLTAATAPQGSPGDVPSSAHRSTGEGARQAQGAMACAGAPNA